MEISEVPQQFVCPITTQIMQIPVVAADGISYQKSSIQLWFMNNTSSPFTGKQLPHKMLIPNYALKKAINTYKQKNPDSILKEQSSKVKLTMRQLIANIKHQHQAKHESELLQQYKVMVKTLERCLQQEKDKKMMMEMTIEELQDALEEVKNENQRLKNQNKGKNDWPQPRIIKRQQIDKYAEHNKALFKQLMAQKIQKQEYQDFHFPQTSFLKWAKQQNINITSDISKFKFIKQLNLSRKNITDIPKSIKCLENLKSLNLSANSIRKIQNLQSLKNLEQLILNNNKIQRIENLLNLRSLQKVYLHDNPATQKYPDIEQDFGTVMELTNKGCAVYIRDWRNPQ